MNIDNTIWCTVCSGRDFELANGAFYCQACGTESREHGQDFLYEKTNIALAENSELCEDSDSNDENHWKNDYPDEDVLQSDNEESTDDEETLKNLGKSHFASDLETDNENQEEQASY